MKDHEGLGQLIGREVSSVEFVRGYVQIRFDGPCLSLFTLPEVQLPSGEVVAAAMAGYADGLVGAVGRIVQSATHSDSRIELSLPDKYLIRVSLDASVRRAAEDAVLEIDGSAIWSW